MHHLVGYGNLNHGLTAGRQPFVVPAQSWVSLQPAAGVFYDPAFGQHDERVKRGSLDDLDHPATGLFRPVDKLAGVAAVGPDQHQPSGETAQLLDHKLAAPATPYTGRVNHHGQDQFEGIGYDMALSTPAFLDHVVVIRPLSCGASVLMDGESITAAESVDFLAASRHISRSLP